MVKMDEKWCCKCLDYTNHNYMGSKSDFEGLGFIRALVAVSSLGVSEITGRTKYWQCLKCGKLKKEV